MHWDAIKTPFRLQEETLALQKRILPSDHPCITLSMATGLGKRISHGGESTPSVYPFAMDTNGSFCDTAILFLKKIAMVKFSNEPGSEPLLAWKRASWVQETCSLIQAAVLRTASRLFHRGLRECFEKDYEHLGS